MRDAHPGDHRRIPAQGKLRNGLYLKSVAFYPDRVVFEVFASREFEGSELATLTLADDLGTAYEPTSLEAGLPGGHASIESSASACAA